MSDLPDESLQRRGVTVGVLGYRSKERGIVINSIRVRLNHEPERNSVRSYFDAIKCKEAEEQMNHLLTDELQAFLLIMICFIVSQIQLSNSQCYFLKNGSAKERERKNSTNETGSRMLIGIYNLMSLAYMNKFSPKH